MDDLETTAPVETASHTPAPWRQCGRGIEAQAFGSWQWIAAVIQGVTPAEASANRALISAAPDLLQALKDFQNYDLTLEVRQNAAIAAIRKAEDR